MTQKLFWKPKNKFIRENAYRHTYIILSNDLYNSVFLATYMNKIWVYLSNILFKQSLTTKLFDSLNKTKDRKQEHLLMVDFFFLYWKDIKITLDYS